MSQYLGSSGSLALFSKGKQGVVVDTSLNVVVEAGPLDLVLVSQNTPWRDNGLEFSAEILDLVDIATAPSESDDSLIAGGARMYTIPGGAQAEAKKALAWRKEEKRGGTPVGLNTARTLAKGGQIGIEKVRHIAKYFPRHEVDKKGKGWKPGEDNFPSNGRIAWALWGGDAAWRWASAIVERENMKPVTAGAYGFVDGMNAFQEAYKLDENFGPEFVVRVRLDGSGFDRLYKIDIDGTVCVWDDCCWDDLGNVDSDIWTYDRALDDPYDTVGKDHVIIDASSALIVASQLDKNPGVPVLMEDIDAEEAYLVALGLLEEDVDFIDTALMSAAVVAAAPAPAADEKATDGDYTPEERSQLAKGQARNALGQFATVGQRVAIAGDAERGSGTITKMDSKAATVDVKLDSGKTVTVDTKFTQPLDSIRKASAAKKMVNMENQPLDTSGILAEPRTPFNSTKGQLPGTLPPMTDAEVNKMMNSWNTWVAGQRASFKPMPGQKNPYAVVKNGKITTQKTK